MGYAFISYSNKDRIAAEFIKDTLNSHGIATWMAPEDIPPGSKYAQVISKSIKESACIILILTDNSQNSKWVSKEIERAIHYDKTIIPIQLEDIILNDEFEFYISTDQIVSLHDLNADSPELQRVIKELSTIVDRVKFDIVHDKPVLPTVASANPIQNQKQISPVFADATLIGKGFAGSVYRTRDMFNGQEISLKKYHPSAASYLPLFTNSKLGKDLMNLRHRNLARIIDIVRENDPCLIMEYIPGIDLFNYMSEWRPGIKHVLLAFRDMLYGLAELHKAGIYYGDLTPHNIIVSEDRFVLSDFSEANYNNHPKPEKTVVVYKYITPESDGMSNFIDAKSDIYQAGILLDDLTYKLINDTLYTYGTPDISYFFLDGYTNEMAPIARIIQRAIFRDPNRRYADINEMIDDITEVMRYYA